MSAYKSELSLIRKTLDELPVPKHYKDLIWISVRNIVRGQSMGVSLPNLPYKELPGKFTPSEREILTKLIMGKGRPVELGGEHTTQTRLTIIRKKLTSYGVSWKIIRLSKGIYVLEGVER